MLRTSGLSPLARGNRWQATCGHLRAGPIPARTGQPRKKRARGFQCRAYPRSHGATTAGKSSTRDSPGLSPLARGNPRQVPSAVFFGGPIPARTGQPLSAGLGRGVGGAYPRSHGATVYTINRENIPWGLSPLARGNREFQMKLFTIKRPIPARTGQPRYGGVRLGRRGAYPRSHGATRWVAAGWRWWWGLSPLARGNLHLGITSGNTDGPIPARTGQPQAHCARPQALGAYPRSHGATSVSS